MKNMKFAGFRKTGSAPEPMSDEGLQRELTLWGGTSDKNTKAHHETNLARAGWFLRCPYDEVEIKAIYRKGPGRNRRIKRIWRP